MQTQQSNLTPKIALFVWGSDDIYWGGWQGFSGVYKRKSFVFDVMNSCRDKDRAEMVDFRTLKRIAKYSKINGKWTEVR